MPAKWQQWMPLKIDKWRGSPAVRAMHPAARSGYLDLILSQWQSEDCSISSDSLDLAELSFLGDELWALYGVRILRNFVTLENGRLRNLVCFEEWEEAQHVFYGSHKPLSPEELHVKRSDAGKYGNKVRWGNRKPSQVAIEQSQNDPKTSLTGTETVTETKTEKPSPEPEQVSLTPDSADARILSETVGIFGMHPQADMLRCLVSYASSSGKSPPDCIEHMAARWEGYRSKPRGRFGYTSSYKFFMSGLWDEPEKWSTEEGANGGPGKSQGDGRSPASDRVSRNLGAIAKALERRGITYPVGSGGADGAEVSGAGLGTKPGGVSSGFRAVGPEILPPQSAGRTG